MHIGGGCRGVFCALVGNDKSKCSVRYSQVVCWLAMVMVQEEGDADFNWPRGRALLPPN